MEILLSEVMKWAQVKDVKPEDVAILPTKDSNGPTFVVTYKDEETGGAVIAYPYMIKEDLSVLIKPGTTRFKVTTLGWAFNEEGVIIRPFEGFASTTSGDRLAHLVLLDKHAHREDNTFLMPIEDISIIGE